MITSASINVIHHTSLFTRAPRRRRLPAGGAGLRRRLTPLAARCSPAPYYSYCDLRPRAASGARGTRDLPREPISRQAEAVKLQLLAAVPAQDLPHERLRGGEMLRRADDR